MQKKSSSFVPFKSSVFSPLSKRKEIGKRSENDGSMPGNTQGIWLKRESESKHFAYLGIQDMGQSCESSFFIHHQEGLLVGNIEGWQILRAAREKKRDRKSLLKPHLSGIMWIDYRPTFQHFEFHGTGKGKSYKLFWFQYFHWACFYFIAAHIYPQWYTHRKS